jgi:hypothetical protein
MEWAIIRAVEELEKQGKDSQLAADILSRTGVKP